MPQPAGATDAAAPLDLLVVGSGVAGLTVAVRAAHPSSGLRVGVLTKAELSQTATRWAQGGIAAVLGNDEDSTDLHLADTLAAGAGLCDVDAVRVTVNEGPERVHDLIALGASFDLEAGGTFSLAREGGHSTARVIHAGGAATGFEIERALVEAVRTLAVALFEHWFALDLLIEGGECRGIRALDPAGSVHEVRATHTVLASGGAGQLFAVTTNPAEATGDGLAMALRAGVPVADVEFMQFHPTALHHPAMPRPLLSEALRGHGALIRDTKGDRFVDELSPRDMVSRAIAARMSEQGVDHLWLDATGLEAFSERFPTIAASLGQAGLDPAVDWLPIAPAAHFLSGGVLTDLDGATAVPGLWACGEVACTGVHGANRLASNSLLEGTVFGARVVDCIVSGRRGPVATGAMRALLGGEGIGGMPVAADSATGLPVGAGFPTAPDVAKLRDELQVAMTTGAGVLRQAGSLEDSRREVKRIGGLVPAGAGSVPAAELANLVVCATSLIGSAVMREESRGAHSRADFPEADPKWLLRIVRGAGFPEADAAGALGASRPRPTV